ncbi:hypothetical protein DY000_02014108 [Brassica cretica]|uniref:V-SNARE coiled-coil homology domain-containing protein n=1 Tax=Brassica cretica TaxID=69181 RepID=A0ABQ7D8J7_BRACR|nr:hypothetical protein DY000_02014108 [Brassica cretica]
MHDDVERPFKENIIELIENGTIKKKVSTDQRERLAMSVERLDQSSDKIRESRRTMMETEDLGVSVLQDLIITSTKALMSM